MLSYKESLKILKETNALLEGHFVLSSGLHSKQYVQCAKLLSFPKKAEIICSALCKKITTKFNNIDIILSPALGGIIVGYEVGRQLNTETIFAERLDGELLLRRGFDIPKGSNVLVVEDVITTGKSARECAKIINKYNSNLVAYACIIDRSSNKINLEKEIVSQIKFNIETYDNNNIPDDLKEIKPIKPGSRNLAK